MLFFYKAKLKTGELIEGTIEAPDRFSLSRDLRSRGSMPLLIHQKDGDFDWSTLFKNISSSVSISEKIIFTKNLSGMLKAGLSLYRALSVLQKQNKNAYLNKVLATISEGINAGETLSMGLAKFPKVFSSLFVSMTRAGEESGNLSNALGDIGMNLEKASSLNKKIRGALIYPGVILSAMLVIGILMFAFVVPTLAGTFKELGVVLPTSTRAIIALGNFFSAHLFITFIILAVFVLAMMALLRTKFIANYADFFIVRLPLIGTLAKELNTARTARTISSLLLSGVSITRALEITEDVVQNIYYKKVLREAKVSIEKGAPFSEIFKTNQELFPIMMSEMIQVGEETGKLSDMLLSVANFYEAD